MPPKIKRPGDVVSPRRRVHRGRWLLLAISALVVVSVVLLCGRPTATPPAAPSSEPGAGYAHPGARELLDGLTPGDAIAGWKVHVLRVVDGQLGVDLLHGDKVLTVWIAKKGSRPAVAPRETERYAIYYGYPLESQLEAARDIEAILNEIEARIRRAERSATPPAGM